MKTKKILFAVLTAALVTAFIIGCITPLEETKPGANKVKSVPEGKALVNLKLGSSARTILPDPDSAYSDATDFTHFKLTVYDTDALDYVALDPPFDNIFAIGLVYNTGTWTFDVELQSNTEYEFKILAFDSAGPGGTTNPVAWGEKTVTIDPTNSGSDSVALELHEIFLDVGASGYKGTFSWSLTLTTYDIANLKLAKVATPSVYVVNANLKAGGATTQGNLDPGKYIMTLELGKTGFQTVLVQEMVYIYSGFDTLLNAGALQHGLPVLRQNVYTITFDAGSDSASNNIHGDTLDVTLGNKIIEAVEAFIGGTGKPAYSGTGYHFEKWRYTNGSGTVVSNLDKMLKNITLFADWVIDEFTTVNLGNGLDVQWSAGPATADFTGTTAVWNNTTNTLVLTLKVVISGGYSGSYKWKDELGNTLSTSDDDTVNLALANDDEEHWFQYGAPHYITLFTDDGSYETSAFTNPYIP